MYAEVCAGAPGYEGVHICAVEHVCEDLFVCTGIHAHI